MENKARTLPVVGWCVVTLAAKNHFPLGEGESRLVVRLSAQALFWRILLLREVVFVVFGKDDRHVLLSLFEGFGIPFRDLPLWHWFAVDVGSHYPLVPRIFQGDVFDLSSILQCNRFECAVFLFGSYGDRLAFGVDSERLESPVAQLSEDRLYLVFGYARVDDVFLFFGIYNL